MNPVSARIWIITGAREAGKTRFCQKVVSEARTRGLNVGGLLSPAVFTDGVKTGFNVQDLTTGETRPLAALREAVADAVTPRWNFDAQSLGWGSEILRCSTPCDLLVIDELGPLELLNDQGWVEGIEALDGGHYRAALVVVRTELLPVAIQHWPQAAILDIAKDENAVTLKKHLNSIIDMIL